MSKPCDCLQCAMMEVIHARHPAGLTAEAADEVRTALAVIAGMHIMNLHPVEVVGFLRSIITSRNDFIAQQATGAGALH